MFSLISLNWVTKIFVITVKELKCATQPPLTQEIMWEKGSLNWAQFMLQWFIRIPEFSEFLFHLGKTPIRHRLTEIIFKLTRIHASVIHQIPWFSVPFRENSNEIKRMARLINWVRKFVRFGRYMSAVSVEVFVNNTNLTFLYKISIEVFLKIKLTHNWPSLVYKSDAYPTVLSRHVLNRKSEFCFMHHFTFWILDSIGHDFIRIWKSETVSTHLFGTVG